MTHGLIVRVQVDRLPNVPAGGGEKDLVQIGVRVSAVISAGDTPLPSKVNGVDLVDDLLPWKWRSLDGALTPGSPNSWAAHDVDSWHVWSLTKVDTSWTPTKVEIVAAVDAIAPNHPVIQSYLPALERNISDAARNESGLCIPVDDEIRGSTVFGLVESITLLPHPVPAALEVFSAFTVKDADPDADVLFIALPRFAPPTGGAINVDGRADTTVFNGEDTPLVTMQFGSSTSDPPWTGLTFEIRASPRLTDLLCADEQQRMEPANLAASPDAIEDEDLAANLPAAIAEAIDPAARVLAVIDDAVSTWIDDNRRTPDEVADLRRDLLSEKPNLLRLLNRVAAQVLWPRDRASAATDSVATALAEVLKEGDLSVADRKDINCLLAVHHSRPTELPQLEPEIDPAVLSLLGRKRLGQLVGLPPEDIAAAMVPGEADVKTAETSEGFLDFELKRWASAGNVAQPLAQGAMRLVGVRLVALPTDALASAPTITDLGVLDTTHLENGGISFYLELGTGECQASISLATRDASAPFLRIEVQRDSNGKIGAGQAGGAIVPLPDEPMHLMLSAERTDPNTIIVTATALSTDAEKKEVARVPEARAFRAPFLVVLAADQGDIRDLRSVPPSSGFTPLLSRYVTATAARANLALAFAGPFMPGILEGRINWWDPSLTPSGGTWAEKVVESAGVMVDGFLDYVWAQQNPPPHLAGLLEVIRDKAAASAKALMAVAVGAARAQNLSRPTPVATPLVVRIDRLLALDRCIDYWGRLAGAGAFIGRVPEGGSVPDRWWSLSAAMMLARQEKPEDDPAPIGVVDPVPLLIGEAAGVRQSYISYANRWLVTGLASDAELSGSDRTHDRLRRPEIFRPPPAKNPSGDTYQLPALSFGYEYYLLVYLIGLGGVLPLWLRQDPKKPLVRKGQPGKPLTEAEGPPSLGAIPSATYTRTRTVGIPNLAAVNGGEKLPALPAGVAPLAGELEIRPPPITIEPGRSAAFFRDDNGRGTLSIRPPVDGMETGLRAFFGNITDASGSPHVVVRLHGSVAADAPPILLASIGLKPTMKDVRIDVVIDLANNVTISAVEAEPSPYPEHAVAYSDVAALTVTDIAVAPLTWRDLFIEVSVPTGTERVSIEPPLAIAIDIAVDIATRTRGRVAEVGKREIAPEASHRSREIVLLHEFEYSVQPKTTSALLTFRRPSVEFATYERWINGKFSSASTAVRQALDDAHVLATYDPPDRQSRNTLRNPAKDFEDPAVVGFHLEVFRIFPTFALVGEGRSMLVSDEEAIRGFQKPIRTSGSLTFAPLPDAPTMKLEARIATSEAVVANFPTPVDGSKTIVIKLKKGCIYEIRVSPIVAEQQPALAPHRCLERMSLAVKYGLRTHSSLTLAAPRVVTVEVAEALDLDAYQTSEWSTDAGMIELKRPPDSNHDVARIRLPSGLWNANNYSAMRRIDRAKLTSQLWSWRGRPQPGMRAFNRFHGSDDKGLSLIAKDAFSDRRDDDEGEPVEQRVQRHHVWGGPHSGDRGAILFEKRLEWNGGMNLRRFGLRLISRYAAIDPSQAADAHHKSKSQRRWAVLAIPDRDNGRKIQRPGLSLVLPLTEPLMPGGTTPPLLAVFNDQMYANGNIADGIDVAVETARHPFTERDAIQKRLSEIDKELESKPGDSELLRERADRTARLNALELSGGALKYWQEFGPDAIRTHAAHDGHPVPLRIDGPIGYGFDMGTEAGRFGTAGYLLSPVSPQAKPWSLIKLRFRRLEAPEALFAPLSARSRDAPNLTRPEEAIEIGIPTTIAIAAPAQEGGVQWERFPREGLIIDVTIPRPGDGSRLGSVELRLKQRQESFSGPVKVSYTVSADAIVVETVTPLGSGGRLRLPFTGKAFHLRLVVSERDKPSEGAWRPAADLAIKLKLERNETTDMLERPAEDCWLAVDVLPILSGLTDESIQAVDQPVKVQVLSSHPSEVRAVARPARISTFAPGVWCQFSEAMSTFNVTPARSTAASPMSVTELSGTLLLLKNSPGAKPGSPSLPTRTRWIEIRLRSKRYRPSSPIRWLDSVADVVAGAQIEHIVLAVVTRYVADAFARQREIPLAALHLTDERNAPWQSVERLLIPVPFVAADTKDSDVEGTLAGLAPIVSWHSWGESFEGASPGRPAGRVRFMKLLVPKAIDKGGFAPVRFKDLKSLFARADPSADPMNPPDAAGMIIGISKPIEVMHE